MPDTKPLDPPVHLFLKGGDLPVETVNQALLILSDVDWPGERNDLHANAVETCLKVIDGHRSAVDARQRFIEAAQEAGVLRSR